MDVFIQHYRDGDREKERDRLKIVYFYKSEFFLIHWIHMSSFGCNESYILCKVFESKNFVISQCYSSSVCNRRIRKWTGEPQSEI